MTEKKPSDANDDTPDIIKEPMIKEPPIKEPSPPVIKEPVGRPPTEKKVDPETTTVVLVDGNRNNPTETTIPGRSVGHTLICNGQNYEHVGNTPDGMRIYAPTR